MEHKAKEKENCIIEPLKMALLIELSDYSES